MTEKELLFRGAIGTPNAPKIEELFELCRKQGEIQRVTNPWHMVASKIRQRGHFDPTGWKYGDLDLTMQSQQRDCFKAVIEFAGRHQTPKDAAMCDVIGACMLSLMLTESPQYVPG